ncbi:MAG: hypothetical protein K0U36_05520 [Alphaproteobacteria bacterium]|nr:hypothetical protein [Alphaproteobacteria bacterium]
MTAVTAVTMIAATVFAAIAITVITVIVSALALAHWRTGIGLFYTSLSLTVNPRENYESTSAS